MDGTDKPKASHKLAFILAGAVAALGAVIGAVAYFGKSAAQATPTGPTKPVWAPLAPAADGSFTIPKGSTFAVSVLSGGNPAQFALVSTFMAGLAAAGQVSATAGNYPAVQGTTPPGWPAADNGGTAATRWTGVTQQAVTIPAPNAQAMSIWLLTGFQ